MHKEATSDVASLTKLGVISGEPGATGWAVGLCHRVTFAQASLVIFIALQEY